MINRAPPDDPPPAWEPSEIIGGLYGDGVIGLGGAFSPAFADELREDIEILFDEARATPGGVLPRGPERYYVEVQPERIRGFVEIATHVWFVAVCEAVLGPDYRIVEVGFDIPFPGAADQPWHRDFAVPAATTQGRRLNSLAFNLTTVDTRPEHGPLEIAPGTQWDRFEGCDRGMFPPRELWPPLCRAGGSKAASARRHLGPLGADHSPGDGEPLGRGATGAGRRRGCAGRDQRGAS
jgi:hypothetical protein